MDAETLVEQTETPVVTQPETTTSSLNPDVVLGLIDESLAAGDDPWQLITDAGVVAAADMDVYRWFIGDLACRVEKKYGEDRIGLFAKAINAPVDRVKEYRTVSKRYEKSARADFSNLTYTHLRDAAKAFDDPFAFLREASANQLTVEAARIRIAELQGKTLPPPKLIDKATCRIAGKTGPYQIIFEFNDSNIVEKLHTMFYKGEGTDLLMDITRWTRK